MSISMIVIVDSRGLLSVPLLLLLFCDYAQALFHMQKEALS